MANSSILGGARAPTVPSGKDIDSLGPSDTSDSGSDVQVDGNRSALPDEGSEGALPIAHDSTGDAAGTGERASADSKSPELDADLLPDRTGVIPPSGGRDDAEDLDAPAPEDLAVDDPDDDSKP
ncbi:hypothetical protein [Variovorax sp. OV329]|uniref:hypothetical protein n=1 Tax=Variovorax sp. OV329 TaxID=1882825 RepID=UPI0008E4C223|nr:hypothetical protein [Variovorax sp. OV329]SFM10278.1 hypothetical protein SAMN05444747_102453 [Variovorax sp. OV329]